MSDKTLVPSYTNSLWGCTLFWPLPTSPRVRGGAAGGGVLSMRLHMEMVLAVSNTEW